MVFTSFVPAAAQGWLTWLWSSTGERKRRSVASLCYGIGQGAAVAVSGGARRSKSRPPCAQSKFVRARARCVAFPAPWSSRKIVYTNLILTFNGRDFLNDPLFGIKYHKMDLVRTWIWLVRTWIGRAVRTIAQLSWTRMAPPASQRVMPAGSRKDCPNRDYSAMSPVPANATASAKKRKRHKDQKRQRRSELAAQKRSEQKAEDAANKTAKRQSVPFDDVVGPGDGDEEWSDVLDDEQPTQRCSPERTARSPQSGDGDEDWSGVLDDEQLTQRCSPERTARSPSPEAVRSPSQPPGTQVPVAGQLDLPELMGELDAAERNAAELRHILSQGLVAVQERVATAAQHPALAVSGECGKCCPGSGKREGHAGRHLKQLVSAAQIGEQIGDAAVSILGPLTLVGARLLGSRKTASSCCPWPALTSRKTTSRSGT